jgi:hypothetical protein
MRNILPVTLPPAKETQRWSERLRIERNPMQDIVRFRTLPTLAFVAAYRSARVVRAGSRQQAQQAARYGGRITVLIFEITRSRRVRGSCFRVNSFSPAQRIAFLGCLFRLSSVFSDILPSPNVPPRTGPAGHSGTSYAG